MSRARAKEARAPTQQKMTHNMMTRSKTRAAAKVSAHLTIVLDTVLHNIKTYLNTADNVNKTISLYKPKYKSCSKYMYEYDLMEYKRMDKNLQDRIARQLIKKAVKESHDMFF